MARSSDAWEGEEEVMIEQGSPRRRVQEDLSEFTKALSSKLWGVASFLAPSPSSQTPSSSPRIYFSPETSPSLHCQQLEPTISGDSEQLDSFESSRTAGFRSDFAEIGGTLKTGIARLSNKVAINGISKIASTFLPRWEEEEVEEDDDEVEQVEEEEEYEDFSDVIGVTDEALAFARNIACHPETWLDFPLLSDDDEDFGDFDMSIAQQDHALVIESLAPRLAALRIELCPTHMSIGDAQHGLQIQAKQGSEDLWRPSSFRDAQNCLTSLDNFETEKRSISTTSEAEFVDKFVVNEEPYLPNKFKKMALENDEDDDDDEWPEDENNAAGGTATIAACDGEDISFSDLEEDEDCFSKQTFTRVCSKSEDALNV